MQVIDISKIKAVMGLDNECLKALEDGFVKLSAHKVSMPDIQRLDIKDNNGEIDIKSAYIEGMSTFTVKMSTGFFDNPKIGLKTGNGMMVVFDAKTGVPLTLLKDDGYLTDIRTALAGALSAKYFAKKDLNCIGLVGAGAQALLQLQALKLVRDIKHVYLWARDENKGKEAAKAFANQANCSIEYEPALSKLVSMSDLLITCTPAKKPLIYGEWLKKGVHITAMGSDAEDKNELDKSCFEYADIVACDSIKQSLKLGELHHAKSFYKGAIEIGNVIANKKDGRINNDQISICDLTGTGMQDAIISSIALHRLSA